jgi:hypothetical protein
MATECDRKVNFYHDGRARLCRRTSGIVPPEVDPWAAVLEPPGGHRIFASSYAVMDGPKVVAVRFDIVDEMG